MNSTDLSLFDQCYNAQAVVAEGSLLVVASGVAQAPNDKQQLEPMLAKTSALPEELGQTETMLADNGYFSEANVKACPAAGVEGSSPWAGCPSSILARAFCRCAAARKPTARGSHGPPS